MAMNDTAHVLEHCVKVHGAAVESAKMVFGLNFPRTELDTSFRTD